MNWLLCPIIPQVHHHAFSAAVYTCKSEDPANCSKCLRVLWKAPPVVEQRRLTVPMTRSNYHGHNKPFPGKDHKGIPQSPTNNGQRKLSIVLRLIDKRKDKTKQRQCHALYNRPVSFIIRPMRLRWKPDHCRSCLLPWSFLEECVCVCVRVCVCVCVCACVCVCVCVPRWEVRDVRCLPAAVNPGAVINFDTTFLPALFLLFFFNLFVFYVFCCWPILLPTFSFFVQKIALINNNTGHLYSGISPLRVEALCAVQ